MNTTRFLLMLGAVAAFSAAVLAQSGSSAGGGQREFTVTGCLLRNGYAIYKVEAATVNAIEGKEIPPPAADSAIGKVKIWNLEGGGNLGPRVGEKVQVVGKSEWKETPESDGPAAKPPILEVTSLKTVASSCM